MAINFHPDRKQMIREVEDCTLPGDLNTLLDYTWGIRSHDETRGCPVCQK
jgi:hypothetical protein